MKINKFKIFLILLIIFAIIAVVIYLNFFNNKEKKPGNIDIKYEKINMITSINLGVSNFDNINPIITKNREVIQLASLIFEPLLEITENYKIKNCLATEWSELSERTYVVKLKENVTWQNGIEFTADDVKFTIDSIKKNKNSTYYENVKDISNVEIVDDHTIRIGLNKKVAFFEYQLIFPILSKEQYEGKDIEKSNEIPLGTGKYKIEKLSGSKITLSKNGRWHGIDDEKPNNETITVHIYEKTGNEYNNFKTGNIDLINTENANYEEYIGSMGYQKKEYAGREYDYLALNCENAVLQNVEVRQAIEKAIDKQKIVTAILENHAYVSNFPLDYGSYLMQGLDLNTNFNQQEAKEILEKAGWQYEYGMWSKEIDGRTRTLNFNLAVNKENEQRLKVAEEIKEQLANIGIEITIQELSEKNYDAILENHNYEIILTGVYNGYSPELNTFLGENNLANYTNEEVKEVLDEADSASSEELQKEKYSKIIEIYKQEVPYIGLYRNKVVVAYNPNLMGDVTPNNYSIFYNFSKWYKQ